MAHYCFIVDGDAPYNHGTLRDKTGSPFLLDRGPRRSAPQIISVHKADLIARNREIARLPFSWVT